MIDRLLAEMQGKSRPIDSFEKKHTRYLCMYYCAEQQYRRWQLRKGYHLERCRGRGEVRSRWMDGWMARNDAGKHRGVQNHRKKEGSLVYMEKEHALLHSILSFLPSSSFFFLVDAPSCRDRQTDRL